MDKTTFKVIDCIDYIYIKYDGRSYFNLSNLLFDNKKAEPTLKDGWYKLEKIPVKIAKKLPAKKENERWVLKEGYVASELMPSVISKEQCQSDEYEAIINCYKYLYDEVDDGYEEIEFEISTIYEKKAFEFVPNTYKASVSELTQIEYPEELYQEFPCKLNREQVMSIIRDHVKKNIDLRYAEITSDYKFSFEVKKKIKLFEPYTKLVDSNRSWSNSRRKPKWVENIISSKSESILHLTDGSSSNNYNATVVAEIIGANYEDLKLKVTKYLDSIMEMINVPYCECPHCQGWGLIKEGDLEKDEKI